MRPHLVVKHNTYLQQNTETRNPGLLINVPKLLVIIRLLVYCSL